MSTASYWTKDPQAVLDYAFDWTAWLGTDLITQATVTASDATLIVGAPTITDGKVVVWLSGGTIGVRPAQVTCTITTAGGRTDERTAPIYIQQR